MGNSIFFESKDFHWEYTDAPHASRRVEILKKHPEIKQLMKPDGDRITAIIGISLVILQWVLACISSQYFCQNLIFAIAFNVTIGSFIASSIFMHMHEAGHNLIFGPNHVWKNRIYGHIMNFGLFYPYFPSFKKYHAVHHKYQGETVDVEYPFDFETKYYKSTFGKYVWMVLNPLYHMYRCFLPQSKLQEVFIITLDEKIAWSTFIILGSYFLFSGYFYFVAYIFLAHLGAVSFNTLAFWNINSHVEFFDMKETTSYYGWLNLFMVNFGYHMEHHDFPNIPSRLLPQVKKIAPDYYEDSISSDSLFCSTIKFVCDSKYGIYSRLKRNKTCVSANQLLH